MEGYESIQSNFALQKFGFGVDLMCCELPRISSSGISIPANYVLENFHHSLQIYCDALSNEFLASFKNSKSETWPLDQCCLMLELAACIQQQRTTETLPPSAKYNKLAEAIATRCNHTTIFILLRQVYSCFWLRCEGDLQGCRVGLLRACQYRKEIDQHDGQYSELEGRIWSYLTVWDRETSILLWQPRIIETASGGVDLSYFLASQNVHRYYSEVMTLVFGSESLIPASAVVRNCSLALAYLRVIIQSLQQNKVQMRFFEFYIFYAAWMICYSVEHTQCLELSSIRELVVWSYDTLSASQSLKELATVLNSIRPLDFQMSRSTHSRFQYQIPELSLEGVGFVFGDGTVVAEPQAIPQLRGALRRMPKPVTCNQAIRIWIDEAVIELSFSEPRQSAELLRLQGNRVRVTAEFSSQIPEQEVKVLLWNQNDGSRRQIGPATKLGRTRWHINITCKDLLGHAVMFSYRREEVISVPVTSEILVSPVPESPEQTCPSEILMSPVPESSELTSPSESGSSLAAADATVGLPQAEREPPCAWVYTYGVGDSALKDILIKHNSDYYTCQAYPSLRKRLIASVKEQHPETGSFKELSITPYRIHYCTEKYVQSQLHLKADFSQDISDRSIIIKTYMPGHQGCSIDAQQHKQASQCSISINAVNYHGKIIVFNCDNEYIASYPVKRLWTQDCDSKLYRLKREKKSDSYIYNSFSPYIRCYITEDLAWFSQPFDKRQSQRRRVVSELIGRGREVHWRKHRQNLGKEFRGMQFKSFEKLWKAECSSKKRHIALHFH